MTQKNAIGFIFCFFRGFLRSDTLVGTASVKLADLLNHCVIHTAVDVSIALAAITAINFSTGTD